jgi:hypothetical protein
MAGALLGISIAEYLIGHMDRTDTVGAGRSYGGKDLADFNLQTLNGNTATAEHMHTLKADKSSILRKIWKKAKAEMAG